MENIRKNDLVLLIVILLIGFLALGIWQIGKASTGHENTEISVLVDNVEIGKYGTEDTTYLLIAGKNNGQATDVIADEDIQKLENASTDCQIYAGHSLVSLQEMIPAFSEYNLILIQNGQADVLEADCRDQICVDTQIAQSGGDSIICLPHKVVIVIEGEYSKLDAVTW